MDAAAEVFAREGFDGASVSEIAQSAGFTVGALYANFPSKDALFLELLATRNDDRLAEAVSIIADLDIGASARRKALGGLLVSAADDAPHLTLLQAEFWLYTLRRPALREGLSAQVRTSREALTAVLAARGLATGARAEAVATAFLALFRGLVHLRRTDPSLVDASLYGEAIGWMLAGLREPKQANP